MTARQNPQGHMAPQCVATAHSGSMPARPAAERPLSRAGFFKSAQWSADGTSILTHNEDNSLRTFILPPDLLTSPTPHTLKPYTTIPSPEPLYATTLYLGFTLSDPATTLVLSSIRDHPIRLHNILDTSAPTPPLLATYPLINAQTESYTTPHSLLIPPLAPHTFIAGSTSRLSIFDFSRPGEGPVSSMPTIPSKRKKLVGGGVGMKGIISALGVSRDGVVAVGTLSRWVGLYDSNGAGGCVGVFPLSSGGGQSGNGGSGREGEEDVAGSGLGITNVEFSPDGTYLYVAERMSDGILVYDIRVQGRSLGVLRGRKAVTNQRMGFEVVGAGAGSGDESEESHEIWAGGTDGSVRVWRNPHRTEGVADPDEEWWAHDDAVSSVGVHPSGSVAATCSGSRRPAPISSLRRSSAKEPRTLSVSSNGSSGDSASNSSLTESSDSDTSTEGSGILDDEGDGDLGDDKPIDNSLKVWSL